MQKTAPLTDQVWIYDEEKRIIYYREPKSTTKDQLDFNFNKIWELGKPFKDFVLLLDLTSADRPGPEIRQHILNNFELIRPKLRHVAIFTGKNFIINMAATFILKKTRLGSYTIQKTQKEAEKALEKYTK